jgi:trimethylamine--corrinoid protein Co-methyltransferase
MAAMRARTTWLSEDERVRIVDQAMELLAGVGMRFAGSALLPELAARGATVEEATGLVRLPRELVEWALTQCPREVLMAGLTEADDVLLGEGKPFHFSPSGCVAKTLDFRTGERRASTLQDVREAAALNDELPNLDIMWTQVSAADVPLEERELAEYFTLLTETRKHVTFVDCPTEVEPVVRICETLAGDLDAFRARPRISTVCTAASPLQVDGGILDVHVELARIGVPIEVYSMTIAGATSPVTLAGTVVQGTAEFLGVATALQVAAPGARLIFCFGSGVLDMLTTTFALGSLESGLMAAMATEVGHHMGVPVLCPGLSTDAKYAGIQAGYEKAMKAATVCAANPDIVTGWGLIDSHNTMSLPQSVIDDEMAGMLRRINAPVEVSDATLAGAAIAAAGPGGSFLGHKDTAKRIRAGEHFLPRIADRLSYEKWVVEGGDEYATACARVETLLAEHAAKPPYVDGDQLDALAAICRVDNESWRRALRD